MSDKTYIIIWGMAIGGVALLGIFLMAHSIGSRRLVAEAISGGADPMEASIAIKGSTVDDLLYLTTKNCKEEN